MTLQREDLGADDHRRFFLAQSLFASIPPRSAALRQFLATLDLLQLHKDEILYREKERSQALYLVREGEIHLIQNHGSDQAQLVSKHGRGSVFGETSFLNQSSHTTSAIATLDTLVYQIPGAAVTALMDQESSFSAAFAHMLGYRMYRLIHQKYEQEFPANVYTLFYPENARRSSEIASVLASAMTTESPGPILLFSLSKSSRFQEDEAHLMQYILQHWPAVPLGEILIQTRRSDCDFDILTGNEIHSSHFDKHAIASLVPDLLGRLKKYYASIIIDAGRHYENPVLSRILDQSDRILLVRNPHETAHSSHHWEAVSEYCKQNVKQFSERVITISDEPESASVTERNVWHSVNPFSILYRNHFRLPATSEHIQEAVHERPFSSGLHRLARFLCGTSRGICFGGGGARAIAHVGVIDILQQAGIDFDAVAGASMGAVIGAAYANGLGAQEIGKLIGDLIPDRAALLDRQLPLLSFFRGLKLERALKRAFGDQRFSDLEIPFFCNGCDLESGKQLVFEEGYLGSALRASVSLPGVFPPRQIKHWKVVDGGVINNLPGSILRDKGYKRIIGVNVSPLEEALATQTAVKDRSGKWFHQVRDYFSVPPVLRIINRSISIQGAELLKLRLGDLDYIFHPRVADFDLFDFHRRAELIEAGRRAAQDSLEEIQAHLKRPVMQGKS
ncbi:MAG: patatin-like phospholipase family protein [Leptospiraceae bacterium]|nr:patatin-like phospholipase family protein [Leptospiraceae bacterium]